MASSSAITQVLETDIWVKATWEWFRAFAEDSSCEKSKFYYYGGAINRWLIKTFSQG